MTPTSMTVAWMVSVAGSGMCLFLAVHAFRLWMTQDLPRMRMALLATLVVSTVVFRPTLPVELAAKLRGAVRKDLEADPGPPPHNTSAPDAPGDGGPLAWDTIVTVLAIAAAVIALLLGAFAFTALVSRRREHSKQELRRSDELAKRRADLEDRHDAVREAYGDFELNLLDNLHRLALADVNVTQTARLIDALDAARDARISTGTEALDTYRTAVTALELAFKSADHHARTTGANYLPRAERRNIEQAQAALAIALDERGYAPQRQLALRRALTLIESVIPVPPEAIAALETSTRPALAKN